MTEASDVASKYTHPPVVSYWQKFSQRGLQLAEQVLIRRHIAPGTLILDLGCGAGRAGLDLLPLGYSIVGLDLTYALLVSGRGLHQQKQLPAHFLQGNMLSLPFPDHHFEAVICLYASIQHVPGAARRQQCFQEMARVLRPGGKLILGLDNLAPALSCYLWWGWRKLVGQSPIPLPLPEGMESKGAAAAPQPPLTLFQQLVGHGQGVARSLRWRTWLVGKDAGRRLGLGGGELGDTMIDRVSDAPTPGQIQFHVYDHQELVTSLAQAGFSLFDSYSQREWRDKQEFPPRIRQLEHQVIYAYQRDERG